MPGFDALTRCEVLFRNRCFHVDALFWTYVCTFQMGWYFWNRAAGFRRISYTGRGDARKKNALSEVYSKYVIKWIQRWERGVISLNPVVVGILHSPRWRRFALSSGASFVFPLFSEGLLDDKNFYSGINGVTAVKQRTRIRRKYEK